MQMGGIHTARLTPAADAAEGAERLAAALEGGSTPEVAAHAFLRIEQPLGEGDPLMWLRQHPVLARIYWRGRHARLELAGVGVCVEHEGPPLEALDELLDQVAAGEGGARMRLFGTMRFDPARTPDDAWRPFGRARFHLPLLELRREPAGTTLAVHFKGGRAALESGVYDAQRRTAIRALRRLLPTPPELPPSGAPPVADDLAAWTRAVGGLLAEIETGSIEKAVLARAALRAAPGVDPLDLLARLREQQPDACQFLVQPSPVAAFLGTSPEHLYVRSGREVRTEALAGTRRRGAFPAEDALLAAALQRSEKDLREHAHVRRHLLDRLGPLCKDVEAARDPTLLSLATLHHLRTPIRGRLKEGVRDAALLTALHPTPAVCGSPTEAALHLLRQDEDFDRGLYAGPVGCFGLEESEVAVAIRSALVRRDWVQLFAGAGIVAGSDPQAEWQETIVKMGAVERLLGAADAS